LHTHYLDIPLVTKSPEQGIFSHQTTYLHLPGVQEPGPGDAAEAWRLCVSGLNSGVASLIL